VQSALTEVGWKVHSRIETRNGRRRSSGEAVHTDAATWLIEVLSGVTLSVRIGARPPRSPRRESNHANEREE